MRKTSVVRTVYLVPMVSRIGRFRYILKSKFPDRHFNIFNTSNGKPAIDAYASACGTTINPTVRPAIRSETKVRGLYLLNHCIKGNLSRIKYCKGLNQHGKFSVSSKSASLQWSFQHD